MDVSKFSERAREALETAQGVVRRGPGNMLGTEHLLIGLLSLPGASSNRSSISWASTRVSP